MPRCACGDQKMVFSSWLSPTMWVPGLELRSSDSVASISTH